MRKKLFGSALNQCVFKGVTLKRYHFLPTWIIRTRIDLLAERGITGPSKWYTSTNFGFGPKKVQWNNKVNVFIRYGSSHRISQPELKLDIFMKVKNLRLDFLHSH